MLRRPAVDASAPGAAIVLGALGIVAGLACWQLLITAGLVSALDLPTPRAVVGALVEMLGTGELWSTVGRTASSAAIGIAIAIAIAVPVGVVLGISEHVRATVGPTIELLRPVPGIALVPLAIVIWGPVSASTIFLVVFGCVWPLIVQTVHGVRAVDPLALETARSYGLTRLERVRWVLVPGALPYIVTGVRICVSVALIVAVGAELIIGTPGMGTAIREAQDALRVSEMYALILVAGMLGMGANALFARVERYFLRWHPAQHGTGDGK